MQVTFTKNAGSYRKGASINLSASHAKLMVALGKAIYGKPVEPVAEKHVEAAPENRMMQAALPPAIKPRRASRAKKKNEYQTKDDDVKKD